MAQFFMNAIKFEKLQECTRIPMELHKGSQHIASNPFGYSENERLIIFYLFRVLCLSFMPYKLYFLRTK